MNKLEVVTRNKIIGDTDGIALDFNKDILTITITKKCKDSIRFINSIYHNVSIIVEDNTNVVFTEIKGFEVAEESKYTYTLGDNSKVIINRFNYMGNYNEKTDVNLNGYQSDILFNLSVMSKGHQQYNINISHNNKKTVSNLYNHGVTLGDGTMDLTVNGYVVKGMSDSVLNQDNRIMTMGTGKSVIKPNLIIDENMVEARHGASIGRFNEEEIFYLETRGVPSEEGYRLLLNGFLLGNLQLDDDIKVELKNIIEQMGR